MSRPSPPKPERASHPRLVEVGARGPVRIRALPLALDHCFTRVASEEDAAWIVRRLRARCAPFGTAVETSDGLIDLRPERR